MMKEKIGVIHPGMMGICVAATVQNSGHEVYWASEGRSPQTRERAEKHNLSDAGSLAALCETCSAIISVCPPHAAEEVAEQVLANSFQGVYLDVNAISPQRTIRIGQLMRKAGVDFVDGGIIGFPVWERGQTWLYLSGEKAPETASFFSGGPLETSVLGDEVGKASALKMCYAAYTKGTTALLCGILATAQALGVRGELETQWSRDWTEFWRAGGRKGAECHGQSLAIRRRDGGNRGNLSRGRHAGRVPCCRGDDLSKNCGIQRCPFDPDAGRGAGGVDSNI